MEIEPILRRVRSAFASGRTLPISFRRSQLNNILAMLSECQGEIVNALQSDLRKSQLEGTLYEVEVVRAEINYLQRNLSSLAAKESLPFNLLACLDSAYIQKEPYGVVLILGPWNYPFSLVLTPLCGAIAAGNCAILKPSEFTPYTTTLLTQLIPQYLDNDCYQVIEADLEGSKELLKNKFDYIFATGSLNMGRGVLAACVPHLTPTTLELGGKSPVYIDESSDYNLAARRIIWGKCMNLGQTCIAPDYILCNKKVQAEFLAVTEKALMDWYGTNLKTSKDLSRIVNERNFIRLQKMLKETRGRITLGGETDQEDLWISPTIIVDVPDDDSLMKEEIFGPLLPIQTVNSAEEAIAKIIAGPKPLAVYVFSKKTSVVNQFVRQTSSGGVVVNDVIWQNGWEGLPFGGVGESGFGSYHGKYSFDTFSHKKAVLRRGFSWLSEMLTAARYPPYTSGKIQFFTFVIRHIHSFNVRFPYVLTHLMAGCFGALVLYLCLRYIK